MVIKPFYAQQVLKAYNVQLSIRSRNSRGQTAPPASKDLITISAESRNRSMAAMISQEIVNNLASESSGNETADEALNQLSQAFGQTLEIEDLPEGELGFRVAPEKKGDPPRPLSPEENQNLKEKLIDITQSIVYRNLSKGGI